MHPTKISRETVITAAFGGTKRSAFAMLYTMPSPSFSCAFFASPLFADPFRTVPRATAFARDSRGGALWIPARFLLAVLATIAVFLLSIRYAPFSNTLASCSVLPAQASRLCFGGAAFDRAHFSVVLATHSATKDSLDALIRRAHRSYSALLLLPYL